MSFRAGNAHALTSGSRRPSGSFRARYSHALRPRRSRRTGWTGRQRLPLRQRHQVERAEGEVVREVDGSLHQARVMPVSRTMASGFSGAASYRATTRMAC